MLLADLITIVKSDLGNHGYHGFLSLPKIYFYNPSFRLLLNFRIGKYLTYKLNSESWLIKYYRYRMVTKRGCDISYKSVLGRKIKFPHPIGIVIGEGSVVDDNVKIWQHVTLGSHGKTGAPQQYPRIGKNVRIYEKSTILGGIHIGDNAIIGAKSLVLKDVPEDTIAIGIPARNQIK